MSSINQGLYQKIVRFRDAAIVNTSSQEYEKARLVLPPKICLKLLPCIKNNLHLGEPHFTNSINEAIKEYNITPLTPHKSASSSSSSSSGSAVSSDAPTVATAAHTVALPALQLPAKSSSSSSLSITPKRLSLNSLGISPQQRALLMELGQNYSPALNCYDVLCLKLNDELTELESAIIKSKDTELRSIFTEGKTDILLFWPYHISRIRKLAPVSASPTMSKLITLVQDKVRNDATACLDPLTHTVKSLSVLFASKKVLINSIASTLELLKTLFVHPSAYALWCQPLDQLESFSETTGNGSKAAHHLVIMSRFLRDALRSLSEANKMAGADTSISTSPYGRLYTIMLNCLENFTELQTQFSQSTSDTFLNRARRCKTNLVDLVDSVSDMVCAMDKEKDLLNLTVDLQKPNFALLAGIQRLTTAMLNLFENRVLSSYYGKQYIPIRAHQNGCCHQIPHIIAVLRTPVDDKKEASKDSPSSLPSTLDSNQRIAWDHLDEQLMQTGTYLVEEADKIFSSPSMKAILAFLSRSQLPSLKTTLSDTETRFTSEEYRHSILIAKTLRQALQTSELFQEGNDKITEMRRGYFLVVATFINSLHLTSPQLRLQWIQSCKCYIDPHFVMLSIFSALAQDSDGILGIHLDDLSFQFSDSLDNFMLDFEKLCYEECIEWENEPSPSDAVTDSVADEDDATSSPPLTSLSSSTSSRLTTTSSTSSSSTYIPRVIVPGDTRPDISKKSSPFNWEELRHANLRKIQSKLNSVGLVINYGSRHSTLTKDDCPIAPLPTHGGRSTLSPGVHKNIGAEVKAALEKR